jgi:peptidyl-prolyl cis-trans isomerase C
MLKPEDEVQARHILVTSEDQAKVIADQIAKGGDFATLAKENSIDAGSKADGGLLGFFGRGQMVPPFEEAAFALQKGDVSKPVRSQYGWHLIKIEDRRQKPPPSFEQVRGQILSAMLKSQGQTVFNELKGKAKIEYLDADVKRAVEDEEKQKAAFEAQMKQQLDKAQNQAPAPDKK